MFRRALRYRHKLTRLCRKHHRCQTNTSKEVARPTIHQYTPRIEMVNEDVEELGEHISSEELEMVQEMYEQDMIDFVPRPSYRLLTWGRGIHGGLGHGTFKSSDHPQIIDSGDLIFHSIATGWGQCAGITDEGYVFCWGWINDVMTCLNAVKFSKYAPKILNFLQNKLNLGWPTFTQGMNMPTPALALDGVIVKQVAFGGAYTIVVSEDGFVYSWGVNNVGQCGHAIQSHIDEFSPVDLLTMYKITQVSCGYNHTLYLSEDGQVFCSGKGKQGQLALGLPGIEYYWWEPQNITEQWTALLRTQFVSSCFDEEGELKPELGEGYDYLAESQKVHAPRFIECATGFRHSTFLSEDGDVYTCGFGRVGSLGHPENVKSQIWPKRLRLLEGHKVIKIAAGHHHNVALTDDGKVFTWGLNDNGQCGRHVSDVVIPQEDFPDNTIRGIIRQRQKRPLQEFDEYDMRGTADNPNNVEGRIFSYTSFEDFEDQGVQPLGISNPCICFPSEIAEEITRDHIIVDITAGFNETALITEDGRALMIGHAEHLVQRPYPVCKIIDLADYVEPGQKIPEIKKLEIGFGNYVGITDVFGDNLRIKDEEPEQQKLDGNDKTRHFGEVDSKENEQIS